MARARVSPKRARFVQEYLKDLNATQACIRAGYSPNGARVTGYWLLQQPVVAEAVQKAQARRAETAGITAQRVLDELARIAFSDLRQLFHPETGELLAISALDKDAAAAVSGVEVTREKTTQLGDQAKGVRVDEALVKVKLWDKPKALELLARHMGMLRDRLEHSGPDGAPLKVTFGGRYRPDGQAGDGS